MSEAGRTGDVLCRGVGGTPYKREAGRGQVSKKGPRRGRWQACEWRDRGFWMELVLPPPCKLSPDDCKTRLGPVCLYPHGEGAPPIAASGCRWGHSHPGHHPLHCTAHCTLAQFTHPRPLLLLPPHLLLCVQSCEFVTFEYGG